MNSLERRLLLGLALALVVLFSVLWIAGDRAVETLTEDFIASRLEHDADSLVAITDLNPLAINHKGVSQFYNQPFSGHYFSLLADDGGRLISRSLWDQELPVTLLQPGVRRRSRVTGPNGQRLLLLERGYRKQGHVLTVAVAEDMTPLEQRRDLFRRDFTLLAVVGLVFLLLIQGLIVRRAFRRLEPVRRDIGELIEGRREALSEDVPDEILPLVRELNHLLRLMTQRIERSRNALGNLAHALKGPLNLLRQHMDGQRSAQGGAEQIQAEAQVQRIQQLMERELKRARLAGSGITGQYFDPGRELPDLMTVLRQIHRHRDLEIDFAIAGEIPPYGDREDMLELLGNLLDNACKWASGRVRCRLSMTDSGLCIEVEDDGPGLEHEALELLARRGVRLDEGTEGHGLGLAIVKDIVDAYGGTLRFGRSAGLGGLRVSVSLPLESHAGNTAQEASAGDS